MFLEKRLEDFAAAVAAAHPVAALVQDYDHTDHHNDQYHCAPFLFPPFSLLKYVVHNNV